MSVPLNQLSNINRFPTTLNTFSMPDAYFVQTAALLAQRFGWMGMNLVCNDLGGFETLMCGKFDALLQSSVQRNLEIVRFFVTVLEPDDVPRTNFSGIIQQLLNNKRGAIIASLLHIKSVNRLLILAVLLLLEPSLLRQFLIHAYDANMTNGDYVKELMDI